MKLLMKNNLASILFYLHDRHCDNMYILAIHWKNDLFLKEDIYTGTKDRNYISLIKENRISPSFVNTKFYLYVIGSVLRVKW